MLLNAPIPRIALENPVGIIGTHIRAADQIVQPWQFGDGYTKATCLWLKGLHELTPTAVVSGRDQRIYRMAPSRDRCLLRSVTPRGMALAMAAQWGPIIREPRKSTSLPLFELI